MSARTGGEVEGFAHPVVGLLTTIAGESDAGERTEHGCAVLAAGSSDVERFTEDALGVTKPVADDQRLAEVLDLRSGRLASGRRVRPVGFPARQIETAPQGHDRAVIVAALTRQHTDTLDQEQGFERAPSPQFMHRPNLDGQNALVAHRRRNTVKCAPHGCWNRRKRHLTNERVACSHATFGHHDHAGAPEQRERPRDVVPIAEHAPHDHLVAVITPHRHRLKDAPRVGLQALDSHRDHVRQARGRCSGLLAQEEEQLLDIQRNDRTFALGEERHRLRPNPRKRGRTSLAGKGETT